MSKKMRKFVSTNRNLFSFILPGMQRRKFIKASIGIAATAAAGGLLFPHLIRTNDNGLSNAFMILQARAMGFDTLIMGVGENEAIRSLFDIPENEMMMAIIALGYRASEPSRPKRRPLDEIVKFY